MKGVRIFKKTAREQSQACPYIASGKSYIHVSESSGNATDKKLQATGRIASSSLAFFSSSRSYPEYICQSGGLGYWRDGSCLYGGQNTCSIYSTTQPKRTQPTKSNPHASIHTKSTGKK